MHSPEDKFQERLKLFGKLLAEEFKKASATLWKFQEHKVDGKWVSRHDETMADPAAKLESWSRGKPVKFIEIMNISLVDALADWALEKMSEDYFKKRMAVALEDFWKRAMLHNDWVAATNLISLARKYPLKIPSGPLGSKFPYQDIKEMKEFYDQALATATEIKRKNKRDNAARQYDLDQKWPDAPDEVKAASKPTDAALEYTAWKFGVKANSLKKKLKEIERYPQDLVDREFRRFAKKSH